MLNRFFGANTHTYLHILGLSGLAFGLPLNKVVMSVSMMFLVLNLVLEAEYLTYWKRIKSNRLFQLIAAYFIFSAISLLWSYNVDYGIHDLKAKLPILVIPTVLAAKPVFESKLLRIILLSFLASVSLTSLFNFFAYNHWIGQFEYDDIRGMSLFSSHVRYALLIVMAIAVTIHLYLKKELSPYILIPIFLWLNYYTYFGQILSGVITLAGVYTTCLFYWAWKKQKAIATFGLLLMVGAFSIVSIWIFKPITYNPEDFSNLPEKSPEGNFYYHVPSIVSPETGKPIDIYIQKNELRREWAKVSDIPYDGFDVKGQHISRTLIRYMASMDLHKDAEGFKQLKPKDIKAIEQGCATAYHQGVWARIYGLQFQLNNVDDPNGHSFLQRIEFWKTAVQLSKKHWFLGVGCGDVQLAFHRQYHLNNSRLIFENQKRSHNMYLTTIIGLGIIGFVLLMWSHFKYLISNFKNRRLIAVLFIIIVLLSYLMEDTLETQTGVTFFALFYALFSSFSKKEVKA